MDKEIKISIIIPVYNAEKYLKRCLDSIINQSFKDIEIICINDGSSDKSLEILKEYQGIDQRIIIYNQKNKGVAQARNLGLSKARGEYLWFVDSDDYILDELACFKLYNLASINKLDIIHFKVKVFDNYLKKHIAFPFFDNFNNQISHLNLNKKLNFNDYKNFFYKLDGALWNKFFSRKFIKNNNICFDDKLFITDDAVFYLKCFVYQPNIWFMDSFFYKYILNLSNGITHKSKSSTKAFKVLEVPKTLFDFLDNLNNKNEYILKGFIWFILNHILYSCNATQSIYKYYIINTFFKTFNFIQENYKQLIKNIEIFNQIKIFFYENDYIKLHNLFNNAKIISFDIFDTLLVRPYSTPQDVFLHLEECFNVKGFAKTRSEAENKACILLNKKLVNYDEIYSCMPKIYQYLKEKEQELEFQTLYVNPEMKAIFEQLIKEGKRVILTSDMYYSLDFFEKLLDKNDIKGYEKIYISGEINHSKHHGDIYKFIANDLDVKCENILHIGDNYYADYQKALENGLQAYHYEAPINQFFKAFPRLKTFYEQNNNLTCHIIIGMLLKKWLQNGKNIENYWEYFGYFYGGPICYGLSKFVYDEAIKEDLKEFIFVARDGFTIEKIFNLLQKQFNTNIKTHYVYAPRALNLQINLEYKNEFSYQSKADSIIRLYKDKIDAFKNINLDTLDNNQKEKLIKENLALLAMCANDLKERYKTYIDSFDIKEHRVGLFDVSAGSFSSMKLIKAALDKTIFGYYWLVDGNRYKNTLCYTTYHNGSNFLHNYKLLELIITAPELPVKSLNEKGEFVRIDNDYEQKRVEIYNEIYPVELEFGRDLLGIFKNYEVDFESQVLVNFLNHFSVALDEDDKYAFDNIYHGVSEDHIKYKKIFENSNIQIQIKNIYGAKERIQNHLSYKLGQELIHAKSLTKIINLPFKLISITKKHKINLKNHQDNTPLEQYQDYEQALQVKNYLSYRLGNTLVKHPFTFIFRVSRVYREWKKENKS